MWVFYPKGCESHKWVSLLGEMPSLILLNINGPPSGCLSSTQKAGATLVTPASAFCGWLSTILEQGKVVRPLSLQFTVQVIQLDLHSVIDKLLPVRRTSDNIGEFRLHHIVEIKCGFIQHSDLAGVEHNFHDTVVNILDTQVFIMSIVANSCHDDARRTLGLCEYGRLKHFVRHVFGKGDDVRKTDLGIEFDALGGVNDGYRGEPSPAIAGVRGNATGDGYCGQKDKRGDKALFS